MGGVLRNIDLQTIIFVAYSLGGIIVKNVKMPVDLLETVHVTDRNRL
jgi:hypothetical protein